MQNEDLVPGLLARIVKALVDDSPAVVVQALEGPDTVTLQLSVANTDIGKVVGKHGRTARSIRTILAAASKKVDKRYELDIRG